MSAADASRRIQARLRDRLLREFRYAGRETGGVLGLREGEIVCSYTDTDARSDFDCYIPSPVPVAGAIRRFHTREGCDEICFIHTHPAGYRELSYADCRFAREFLRLNPGYQRIGMMLSVDGELLLYAVYPACREAVRLELTVI